MAPLLLATLVLLASLLGLAASESSFTEITTNRVSFNITEAISEKIYSCPVKNTTEICGISYPGEIILKPIDGPGSVNESNFMRFALSEDDPITDTFLVTKRSLYCITVVPQTGNAEGTIYSVFPYGKVPALDYPLLPFYGFLGLFYLAIGFVWAVLCALYWKDILRVQLYISGVVLLNLMECIFYFAFYNDYNKTGVQSMPLLTISVIFGAGSLSSSLSAFLVVCMGFGLVKPTLGTTGHKVFILGFVNFLVYCLFKATQVLNRMQDAPEQQSYTVLMIALAQSIILAIYFFWISSSLSETMSRLVLRHQSEKLRAYKYLNHILYVALFAFLFGVIVMVLQNADVQFQRENWHLLWFTNVGLFQLLYTVVLVLIMFLWRPTTNNSRFTLEQIPLEERVTSVQVGDGKLTSRTRTGREKVETEVVDEDLKWVEDNIPVLEEIENILASDVMADMQEHVRMIKNERSKMN
ncbi:hypothetical protein H696_05467 [Fonticula alba]|uniref:GOST seven transmembrane domain-containing protein n=1 Tax=Fonticula alba TaxID=691883 RepID=A0A058Z1L9_FONAL|nr:hypothetical protein H696_05467 [Fonticula alba]KCV68001.1 hypothetical protein H696_05467 [Fonticula alba]|eukprot:XP_009497568.1 hypothetical protein H696_05467 [Fonticula alba]